LKPGVRRELSVPPRTTWS